MAVKLTQKELNWIINLQRKQKKMLMGKDDELAGLYKECNNENQIKLVEDLLISFNYFDAELHEYALNGIAKHIKSFGYNPKKTAIVALCKKKKTDSSQSVVYELQIPLFTEVRQQITNANKFAQIRSLYKEGYRHFIGVDEFIGSGKTVKNRAEEFASWKLEGATLDFCFTVGMKHGIENCRQAGINIYVEYDLPRGISDSYDISEVAAKIADMKALEKKLGSENGPLKLKDYTLGYGQAEALYYRHNINIPNNVFPIFWWRKGLGDKDRLPLFVRV